VAQTPSSGGEEGDTSGSYEALVARGNRALERGKDEAARAVFEAALRQRVDGAEAQTGLGNYYLDVNKPAKALLYFQRAADRGYGEALFYLAEAERQQGAVTEALGNYKRYLEKGGHGQNAEIAERALHDLAGKENHPERPAPAGKLNPSNGEPGTKPRARLPPPEPPSEPPPAGNDSPTP
jgi:tetratricopeptide (TPR) repeat protein